MSKAFSGQVHAETQETGQGSETHSETETPNNGANMGNGSMTNTSHQQQYGSMGPGPSNAQPGTNSSSNPKHSSDEFFNFPDMDCLIQNLSGAPQGSGTNSPNPAQGAYHFDPAYHDEQVFHAEKLTLATHFSHDKNNYIYISFKNNGHKYFKKVKKFKKKLYVIFKIYEV